MDRLFSLEFDIINRKVLTFGAMPLKERIFKSLAKYCPDYNLST